MIKKNDLKNKKIAVIGAGISGMALAELAKKLGADVFVSDANKLNIDAERLFVSLNIAWEENGNTEKLLEADEIVVSSGISPQNKMLKEARKRKVPIVGELDFVYPYLSGNIIGVTGSNGKTTTTSMIGYYLNKLGYSVAICGNIGNPLAKVVNKTYDFIVMELSSFQLHWAYKFKCNAAVITNLAPDHIDWHCSYENYVAAKANLIKCLDDSGFVICQKTDMESLRIGKKNCLPLFWKVPCNNEKGIYMDIKNKTAWLNSSIGSSVKSLFKFDEINLLGTHNMANTAMVLALLSQYGITVPKDLIASYVPPKHRCSYVGKAKSIVFIDDSKGTNVAASVAAMTALDGVKIIILGGQGKGESYDSLAAAVKKFTKHAVLIGSEKEKIKQALKKAGYKSYSLVSTMQEAVETAYSKASAGDTVLLSPACTSWDMYSNYGERGDHFCAFVKEIIERELNYDQQR